MGKHETGFARVERDLYPTPAWVIEALAEHVDLAGTRIWECACGTGQMSEALKAAGASVYSSDVEDYGYVGLDAVLDFVAGQHPNTARFSAIITNPPFGNRGKLAEQFIETGLRQLIDFGFMALLLPVDFDSAKTRPRFFASCSHFAGKIILAKRIVWFANPDPKRENPKENSAWFLWSRNVIRGRPPIIRYAPRMLERKMTRHARQLDLFRQVAPLPPHDRSHGLSVQMAMPCRCGATLAVIGPGKAPHAAALHCEGCDVHRGWVSHATHRFLIELINRFGRPVEPVAIRRGGQ